MTDSTSNDLHYDDLYFLIQRHESKDKILVYISRHSYITITLTFDIYTIKQ